MWRSGYSILSKGIMVSTPTTPEATLELDAARVPSGPAAETTGGRDVNVPARLSIASLLRAHWKAMSVAMLAVLGETLADVLQPWPIKVVIDSVLGNKHLPHWLEGATLGLFGSGKLGILKFAVVTVAVIAVVDAVSSYMDKYTTTSVSQWIAHDMRRMVYNHIQQLR